MNDGANDSLTIAIPVDAAERTAPAWGRAQRVAVATVQRAGDAASDWSITDWRVHDVGWNVAHDEGTEGAHHARIVKFLREHAIRAIVVDHVGEGMHRMLHTMGIPTLPMVQGDAQASVLVAIAWATGQAAADPAPQESATQH